MGVGVGEGEGKTKSVKNGWVATAKGDLGPDVGHSTIEC